MRAGVPEYGEPLCRLGYDGLEFAIGLQGMGEIDKPPVYTGGDHIGLIKYIPSSGSPEYVTASIFLSDLYQIVGGISHGNKKGIRR